MEGEKMNISCGFIWLRWGREEKVEGGCGRVGEREKKDSTILTEFFYFFPKKTTYMAHKGVFCEASVPKFAGNGCDPELRKREDLRCQTSKKRKDRNGSRKRKKQEHTMVKDMRLF